MLHYRESIKICDREKIQAGQIWREYSKTSVDYLSDYAYVIDVSCVSVDLSVCNSCINSLAVGDEAKSRSRFVHREQLAEKTHHSATS